MNTPRGYNPVGESAPGLPRHDAPLPGHAPGQYAQIGGGGDEESTPSFGPGDAGFPPWFGIWAGRIIMAVAVYVTLPIQVALYPIAGAAGLLAGGAVYLALIGTGMGRDAVLDWAWTACFVALLLATKIEIGIEDRIEGYRKLRHWLRLALVAGVTFYFEIFDQKDPVGTAIILTLIVAVLMHFILRAKLAAGLWHGLQTMLWLRKV
jgi:hypothetical protein